MKRVAVINDLSGLGRCSLTAAIPIISSLGIECCPLPTAILSNQTGYDSFYCTDYTENMKKYIVEWKKLGVRFDAIMTGYLTCGIQADIIFDFINTFADEKTLVLVDPVMADDGRLYGTYSKSLCRKVAALAAGADIITPNLTEMCILCRKSYKEFVSRSGEADYLENVAATARVLLSEKLKTVIVTGVKTGGCVCNVLVQEDNVSVSKSEIIGGSYSGTGDIFASVICAEAVKGTSLTYSVELATRFLEKSIRDSHREGTDRNDGVNFQKYLGMIINDR